MSTMGTHEMQQNKYSNIQENIQDWKYIYIYIFKKIKHSGIVRPDKKILFLYLNLMTINLI